MTNLKIGYDPIVDNISDHISKHRIHLCIRTKGEVCKKSQNILFSFLQIEREDILKVRTWISSGSKI